MWLGEPEIKGISQSWDEGRISINPGLHMLCDVDGTGLYLGNVKNGQFVMIKTADAHFPAKHFLYTNPAADGYGEYFGKTKQTTCKYHIHIVNYLIGQDTAGTTNFKLMG